MKYSIVCIPDKLKKYIPYSIDRIFSWLYIAHPEIMTLIKIHCYDRNRKNIMIPDPDIKVEGDSSFKISESGPDKK
jgi:hypothetical protein